MVSQHYNTTLTWKIKHSNKPPTATQERFARTASKADKDMTNPEKKEEWQSIANAANSKYKTSRGAAFALYYNEASMDG